MRFCALVFLPLLGLYIFGCATTGKQFPSEDVYTEPSGTSSHLDKHPREIIGSGPDERVLHRDIVKQQAQSGDYIMVFDGKKLEKPKVLNAGDIEYSKKQVAELQEELLDTGPGSVRALLAEIAAPYDNDPVFRDTVSGSVEEIDLSIEVLPGTQEFISNVQNRQQMILITTRQENWTAYDVRYKNPPWVVKVKQDIGSGLITIILLKKVDSNQDTNSSYNEDIESTKKRLREIIETINLPPPPKPAPPPPKPAPPPPPPPKQAWEWPSIDMGLGAFVSWPLPIASTYLQAVSPSYFSLGIPFQAGGYLSIGPVLLDIAADAQIGIGYGPGWQGEGSIGGSAELVFHDNWILSNIGIGVGYGMSFVWPIKDEDKDSFRTSYLRLELFASSLADSLHSDDRLLSKIGVYTQFFGNDTWGLGLILYFGSAWGFLF